MTLPYKGTEKLRCPICKLEMTYLPDTQGFFCRYCDAAGLTHVTKRGGKYITERVAEAIAREAKQ